ncbi:3-isopropylmalate/(R)-2-methylmalate dehydratase small subunit [Weissella beninensis]|uniref:3-isopropylmalate dehydratase small subunit n=1 Tax=Periweissella beninensis TaxID=504936 RepID=A0ABT0VHE2_9LACO|nr:3-isopropylmalate dehydratase small subunit [Periweissella beninensis]MBM7543444.1 3-isopropylmalate/(R)-2-methylmalate dehydratase small subunit [Periweissella beninensis]MCM2437263.1 3-isopropylmalate dehydratase small subunit [Periweissella beninensis]
MQPITIIKATTVPLMKENIDTDQIIPKQFLKNILKTGFGKDLFFDWRYDENGQINQDFVLNKPLYKSAEILITGNNFGCESSREHAVWALKDYGFKAIIAGGYSDIFYMNSTKNGLLAIVLPEEDRQKLAKLAATQKVAIHLPNQNVSCGTFSANFLINKLWKDKLIKGQDDIDLTLQYAAQITAFEQQIPNFD